MSLQQGSSQKAVFKLANAGNDAALSNRVKDINGWMEIKGNPISKVGVFPYLGAQISEELEPNKIYQVYRPEEALNNSETIESFKLLPWVNEHEMLGDSLTPAEKKGVEGIIGEDIYFEDNYLKANIKIFSKNLADLIQNDKKELSIGYRCLYDLKKGVYNGQPYDAIQHTIRGNHLALVDEGRSGPDVAVLDHFKFTIDTKDVIMEENMEVKDTELTLESLNEKIDRVMEAMAKMMEKPKDETLNGVKIEDEEGEKPGDQKKPEGGEATNESKKGEFKTPSDQGMEEKKEVMDAKLRKIIKDEIKNLMSTTQDSTDIKFFLTEIQKRNELAQDLSHYIGTFDHSDKTLKEVADYGIKELRLTGIPKGGEVSALVGYIAAAKKLSQSKVTLDSKMESENKDSLISDYFKGDE